MNDCKNCPHNQICDYVNDDPLFCFPMMMRNLFGYFGVKRGEIIKHFNNKEADNK